MSRFLLGNGLPSLPKRLQALVLRTGDGRRERRIAKESLRPTLIRAASLPIIAIIISLLWNYYHKSDGNKIIILVADFHATGQSVSPIINTITEELQAALKGTDAVELRVMGEKIPDEGGRATARAIGKQNHAAIVIWGEYEKQGEPGMASIYFEMLRHPILTRLTPGKKETLNIAATGPDSIAIKMPLPANMRYVTLFAQGLARYCAQDFDGAIDSFNAALPLQPASNQFSTPGALHLYRGISQFDLYRAGGVETHLDNAIADYAQALKTNTDDVVVLFDRGLAFYEKGDFDAAIADYGRVVSIKQDYAEAYFALGISFEEQGDFDRATANYDRAIKLNPKHPAAYNNRGDISLNKGDVDHAIADYCQAVTLKPGLAIAYYNRGRAYALKGNKDNALADFDKVLRLTKSPDQRRDALQAIQELNRN